MPDILLKTSRPRSPLKFFLLVFALSLPFWLAGTLTERQLLPGLPVAALMFVCPAIAAVILARREHPISGAATLMKRAFDFKRIKGKFWYAPILLLMPGVAILQYAWMRWQGVLLPIPQYTVVATAAMSLAFFVAALGEELGWSGYAIDPMQARLKALSASILLGLVWAVWHVVPLVQARRTPVWIAWWSLGTVATRVLIVWVYNNTGKSVFGAAVFHATGNIAWQLFPIHGSHFNPRVNGLILALVAIVVVAVWGPRTLGGDTGG
jgi:membrane protease YdiL (CAAX protease family)